MTFDFPALIVHAAKTRALAAGTILGAGTVSNRDADGGPGKPISEGGLGYSCVAELRVGRDDPKRQAVDAVPEIRRPRADRDAGRRRPFDFRRDRSGFRALSSRSRTAWPRASHPPATPAEKKISFDEIGRGLYAFTAEGDPNSGIIVGDDGVMVVDAQATPVMAIDVIERVRKVTDKPIKYVLLSHYHAVRVLGASAYIGRGDRRVRRDARTHCRARPAGQGFRDRTFSAAVPGGRIHSRPDLADHHLPASRCRSGSASAKCGSCISAAGTPRAMWSLIVPDANVVFSGDLVEYHSACYCGDAHFSDWPATLDRLAQFKAERAGARPRRGARPIAERSPKAST